MVAPEYALTFDEGADLDLQFFWEDAKKNRIDLVGFTAQMMVKNKIDGNVSADWSAFVSLNTPKGAVNINVPAANTTDIGFIMGVFDIELISPSGKVYKFLKGTVRIYPEVTNL